jgi:hypothetical protein
MNGNFRILDNLLSNEELLFVTDCLKNKKFNYIYLAAPGSKRYLANKYPKKDKKNIFKLISVLKKVKCKKNFEPLYLCYLESL